MADAGLAVRAQAGATPKEVSPALLPAVRTVAVWGPVGAPGKSTLALNLADALSVAGKRTLLIDADLVAPSLALLVGAVDQASGISAACKLAREARLDQDELLRVSIKVDAAGATFWLLPGISGASRWPEITPSALESLLRVASSCFDVAIIDLASSLEPSLSTPAAAISRNELTRFVVANADQLLAVGQSDALSVHRMLRQVLDVQRLRFDGALTLVANRVKDSATAGNTQKQLLETYRSLVKLEPQFFLPSDEATIDSAVRAGVPVRLIKRRSPYAKAVQAMARGLRV